MLSSLESLMVEETDISSITHLWKVLMRSDTPWTVSFLIAAMAVLLMAPAIAFNDNYIEQSIAQSASGTGLVQLEQKADSYAHADGLGSSISQDSIQQSTGLCQGADVKQEVLNWVDSIGELSSGGGNEISADNIQITEGVLASSQRIVNCGEVRGSGNKVHHHNIQKLESDSGPVTPEKTENAFKIKGDGNEVDLDNKLDNQYRSGESPMDLAQSTCIDINGDNNFIKYSNLALGPVMSSIQGYFGIIT